MRPTLWVSRTCLLVVCLAGIGACGGDPPSSLALGTFAGTYKAEINNDCQQYSNCQDMMDQPVKAGWVENCVNEEATKLNADTSMQPPFLTKVTRCTQRVGCEYTGCVKMPPVTSYGMTQFDKINYLCQAKADCHATMGNPVDDPPVWVANCGGTYIGALDTWTTDQRSAFEAMFGGCSSTTACEFIACMGNLAN